MRRSISDGAWCSRPADVDVERLRLFVAVSIPRSHLEEIDRQIAPFKEKVTNARWVPLDNQHVTLKFLGTTPGDRLPEVEKVCAMAAASHHPATLSLGGVGAFPSRTRVRVLWVGLQDEGSLLQRVATDLDQGFEALGYPTESRAFTPHLTLCRFRMPVPLKGGLPELDTSGLEPFPIDAIQLFRSHLSPKGARYEVLKEFPIGA